ncbi:hypothetical protein SmJEL517_g02706 [Synchytrium microbalum]|uniref:MARVEL domain-containing protein n=1 Tax=Synchytrium microbalum TaxID=1806994 RepID=A0A507C9L3_9FUNG|nr:uncharacterized protein SmJEL517_g02706 [Synchytrium microbalum]TPX34664.1 hypothetical protein SmJEL517_g02706 [Synchytrium microbalum]
MDTVRSGLGSVWMSPRFILRAVEWLFALIAFSTAASYTGFSYISGAIGFMIFVGVLAWLLDMAFMALYIFRPNAGRSVHFVELIISALWTFFWFAAWVAMAAQNLCGGLCSTWNASIAFGAFSMVAWGVSTFMVLREYRKV